MSATHVVEATVCLVPFVLLLLLVWIDPANLRPQR